jgi:hypothetical protein
MRTQSWSGSLLRGLLYTAGLIMVAAVIGCAEKQPPPPTPEQAAQQPPLSAEPGPASTQQNKLPD